MKYWQNELLKIMQNVVSKSLHIEVFHNILLVMFSHAQLL